MSEWTPESLAAHKARLEIIEKLGWGPSSIAGPDWIVDKVKREKKELELQVEKLKTVNDRQAEDVSGLGLAYKSADRDRELLRAEIAGLKNVDIPTFQSGLATANQLIERLQYRLNAIRGLLLCPPADLECRIMKLIEDDAPEVKRKCPRCGGPDIAQGKPCCDTCLENVILG